MPGICSRDLPFVSGTSFQINTKAITDVTIYIQNVNALPIEARSIGNVCDTTYTESHKKKIAKPMALPLTWFGKISATTTNVRGPNEIAKKEM